MPPSWSSIPEPRRSSNAKWKRYLGEACPHGRHIVTVDGTHIRNRFDSDFSQGGNGYAYSFIPKSEIWIDRFIPQTEWPYIAFHECQEAERMKKGMSYGRAHDETKAIEDAFRKGDPMPRKTGSAKLTSKPVAKLTGKARDLASKYIAEEITTGKYPRKQAIAIGLSRAKTASRKIAPRRKKKVS